MMRWKMLRLHYTQLTTDARISRQFTSSTTVSLTNAKSTIPMMYVDHYSVNGTIILIW